MSDWLPYDEAKKIVAEHRKESKNNEVKKNIEKTLGHEISTMQFEQIIGRIVRRGKIT